MEQFYKNQERYTFFLITLVTVVVTWIRPFHYYGLVARILFITIPREERIGCVPKISSATKCLNQIITTEQPFISALDIIINHQLNSKMKHFQFAEMYKSNKISYVFVLSEVEHKKKMKKLKKQLRKNNKNVKHKSKQHEPPSHQNTDNTRTSNKEEVGSVLKPICTSFKSFVKKMKGDLIDYQKDHTKESNIGTSSKMGDDSKCNLKVIQEVEEPGGPIKSRKTCLPKKKHLPKQKMEEPIKTSKWRFRRKCNVCTINVEETEEEPKKEEDIQISTYKQKLLELRRIRRNFQKDIELAKMTEDYECTNIDMKTVAFLLNLLKKSTKIEPKPSIVPEVKIKFKKRILNRLTNFHKTPKASVKVHEKLEQLLEFMTDLEQILITLIEERKYYLLKIKEKSCGEDSDPVIPDEDDNVFEDTIPIINKLLECFAFVQYVQSEKFSKTLAPTNPLFISLPNDSSVNSSVLFVSSSEGLITKCQKETNTNGETKETPAGKDKDNQNPVTGDENKVSEVNDQDNTILKHPESNPPRNRDVLYSSASQKCIPHSETISESQQNTISSTTPYKSFLNNEVHQDLKFQNLYLPALLECPTSSCSILYVPTPQKHTESIEIQKKKKELSDLLEFDVGQQRHFRRTETDIKLNKIPTRKTKKQSLDEAETSEKLPFVRSNGFCSSLSCERETISTEMSTTKHSSLATDSLDAERKYLHCYLSEHRPDVASYERPFVKRRYWDYLKDDEDSSSDSHDRGKYRIRDNEKQPVYVRRLGRQSDSDVNEKSISSGSLEDEREHSVLECKARIPLSNFGEGEELSYSYEGSASANYSDDEKQYYCPRGKGVMYFRDLRGDEDSISECNEDNEGSHRSSYLIEKYDPRLIRKDRFISNRYLGDEDNEEIVPYAHKRSLSCLEEQDEAIDEDEEEKDELDDEVEEEDKDDEEEEPSSVDSKQDESISYNNAIENEKDYSLDSGETSSSTRYTDHKHHQRRFVPSIGEIVSFTELLDDNSVAASQDTNCIENEQSLNSNETWNSDDGGSFVSESSTYKELHSQSKPKKKDKMKELKFQGKVMKKRLENTENIGKSVSDYFQLPEKDQSLVCKLQHKLKLLWNRTDK